VIVGNYREGGWWWRLPILAILWLMIATPIVIGWILTSKLRGYATDLPEVPDLTAWRAAAPQTTRLLAADGSILAELPFQDGKVVGHRTLVPLATMPMHLVMAVLAAEDVRFWEHKGADYQAIARAALANYRAGKVIEGASTVTQQLARNLLPQEIGSERSVKRKVREVLLARRIERAWSKNDVLETYLGLIFLGQGAYGMAAGARAYFDCELRELDLPQAAMLAGLIQAPARLDPYRHPEAAKVRRDEILARMLRAKMIDETTRAKAVSMPIALSRPRPYYGSRVPWYTEQVRGLLAGAIPGELARGGLIVDTAALPALGSQLQDEAVAHADRWGKTQVAGLIWDHRTGYVEALVGGRDWDPDRFDRMLQSCRQPGSAWKPMVYGSALESGAITPGTALRDAPIADYDERTNVHWKPKSGAKFRGIVLAQDAFAASLNAPAIDVLDRVGTAAVIAFAKKLGVSTDVADVRPMALGASCVKPIELARAYAVIARRGWAIAPRFAVRVQRGDETLFDAAVPEDPWLDPARRLDRIAFTAGKDPDERIDARGGRLLDERTAFQLQDMMAAWSARLPRGAGLAPPPARPAPRTTTPMPGSSASRGASSGRCGSASMTRRRSSAPRATAHTQPSRCGSERFAARRPCDRVSRSPACLLRAWSASRSIARPACSRLPAHQASRCGSVQGRHRPKSPEHRVHPRPTSDGARASSEPFAGAMLRPCSAWAAPRSS
jgi:membrane carboxypeptidase/penicillin-binding protein